MVQIVFQQGFEQLECAHRFCWCVACSKQKRIVQNEEDVWGVGGEEEDLRSGCPVIF